MIFSAFPDAVLFLKQRIFNMASVSSGGPQSLPPSSVSMATNLHCDGIQTHMKINRSSAPVVINPDTVFSSMKDSLRSMTNDHSTNATETVPTVMCVQPISHIPPSDGALDLEYLPQDRGQDKKATYKLVEVVGKEPQQYFQGAADYDLEPYQFMSTRRRSRNFFTLTEENEDDTLQTDIEPREDRNKSGINVPVFHLGKSLRRLYYPFEKEKKTTLPKKEKDNVAKTCGYESEPDTSEEKLLMKIQKEPELRRISSTPQLSSLADMATDDEDAFTLGNYKSKAFSNSQDMTRKLQQNRQNKTINETDPGKKAVAEHKRPFGFSIFSHLAGDLHLAQRSKAEQLEESKEKKKDNTVAMKSADSVDEQKDKKSTSKQEGHSEGGVFGASGNGGPNKGGDKSNKTDKSSFINSVISWSTTTKVKVSHKENNIYSPTSF